MKAKELNLKDVMCGDWVDIRNNAAPNTPHLEKITPSHFLRDEHWYGIELTPEILEKNGWIHEFDKTDYMVKYDLGKEGKNCWMMWSIKENNLDVQRQDKKLDIYNLKVSRVVIPCDYVHQLQHALRLCGIEKEIVI